MKKFFEEYGKFAIAAIVIILLLVMIKPIGAAIQESINTTTDEFVEKTNNAIFSMGGSSPQGSIDVSKGDLITIDSKEYRVLSINGTRAKVLAMNDAQSSYTFNDSSITTSFNGTNGQKYEGSKLDNYLENTWFTGLSQDMKDAIIPQDITQNMFKWNGTPAALSSWYKNDFTETDTSGTNYALSKTDSISVDSRHVYALDVQDVIDYLGSSFQPQDLNDMFYQQRSTISKSIWLRSAGADSANYAFYVYGSYGGVINNNYTNTCAVRPAFVIDLSKVEWSKVQ